MFELSPTGNITAERRYKAVRKTSFDWLIEYSWRIAAGISAVGKYEARTHYKKCINTNEKMESGY